MKDAGANNMLSDGKAPANPSVKLPGKSQNVNEECGYAGGGSAPLDSAFWTGEGPTAISGGH